MEERKIGDEENGFNISSSSSLYLTKNRMNDGGDGVKTKGRIRKWTENGMLAEDVYTYYWLDGRSVRIGME